MLATWWSFIKTALEGLVFYLLSYAPQHPHMCTSIITSNSPSSCLFLYIHARTHSTNVLTFQVPYLPLNSDTLLYTYFSWVASTKTSCQLSLFGVTLTLLDHSHCHSFALLLHYVTLSSRSQKYCHAVRDRLGTGADLKWTSSHPQ